MARLRLLIVLAGLVAAMFSPIPDGLALRFKAVPAAAPPAPTPVPTATPVPKPPVPLTAGNTVLAYPAPPIRARAAILIDLSTGRVLYAKNPDMRLPMASTTKITTAAVVLHHARLNTMVHATRAAVNVGESTMELRLSEILPVRDLLYGLLLNSGNDAAVALAQYVGGTEAHFVAMMNDLARRLHMRNTHYMTPHGLDTPGHYTSARDLSIIARYAMRSRVFRQIVSTENYHIPKTKHNVEHYLGNVNLVMYWYPGVDGVKPGDTDQAGFCQVVTDTRNGHRVMAVLLNTPDLVVDIRNLLNMGTRDFQWVQAPLWSDAPADALSGGSGNNAWLYYYGAGHYIRGPFLSYFQSHGALRTFGYPRTEQLVVGGQTVQFFQGGELALQGGRAVPVPVGQTLARTVAPRAIRPSKVAAEFRSYYHFLGGPKVLGIPITRLLRDRGVPVQFFRNGELAMDGGSPRIVPAGDATLRLSHWLPANGAANSFPPSLDPGLEMRYVPPPHIRIWPHRHLIPGD